MVPADALKAVHTTNTAVSAKIFFILVLPLKILDRKFATIIKYLKNPASYGPESNNINFQTGILAQRFFTFI